MNPDILWFQFFDVLTSIAPWFLLGGGTLFALSLSPLGRSITRYLQQARRPAEPSPELLDELGAVHRDLIEVLERLDYFERRLGPSAQGLLPHSPAREPGASSETRVRTPV